MVLVGAVLKGFGDVFWLDSRGVIEVGNSASKFDRAHIGSCAEAELLSSMIEHFF